VQDLQTRQLIGTTCKIGRLFKLSSLHLPPIVSATTPSRSPSTTLNLWHSHLGHASVSHIRSLAISGQLGSVESKSFDCVACFNLENKVLYLFNNSDSISSVPFDLVHSDVWRLTPIPTIL
jgi:hypothetical protein